MWVYSMGEDSSSKSAIGSPAVQNAYIRNTWDNPWAMQAAQDKDVLAALVAGESPIPGVPASPLAGTKIQGGQFYNKWKYMTGRVVSPLTAETIQVR